MPPVSGAGDYWPVNSYSLDKLTDADTELASCSIAVALLARIRVGGTTPTAHAQLSRFYGILGA